MMHLYNTLRSCYAGTFARGPGGSQIGVWGRDECRGSWAVSQGTETQGTRTSISKENSKISNFQNFQKIIESKNSSEKNNFSKIENLKNVTLHENFDQDLYCFQVTECVVRPDIELKKLMACAMRVGEVRHSY